MRFAPFVLLISIFSSLAWSAQTPMNRFLSPLNEIGVGLKNSQSKEEAAQFLTSGDRRIITMHLQSLGRIYSRQIEIMKDFRKDFKTLEDLIGDFKKWDDLGQNKKAEVAFENLADELDKDNWINKNWNKTKVARWLTTLSSYDWPEPSIDRDIVLDHIANKTLQKVIINKYDLSILEDTDEAEGVHELRRNIRNVTLEVQAVRGLIQYKENGGTCPIEQYASLPFNPNGKYHKLWSDPNELEPCLITRCLFLSLIDAVDKIGKIKDDMEEAGESNSVDAVTQTKVSQILDNLRDSGALTALQSELLSCRP